MTEIVGKCISVDRDALWILDEQKDKIKMVLNELPNKAMRHLQTIIGKRISFYFDENGMKITDLSDDGKTMKIIFK